MPELAEALKNAPRMVDTVRVYDADGNEIGVVDEQSGKKQ